jgi:hypothetical protein
MRDCASEKRPFIQNIDPLLGSPKTPPSSLVNHSCVAYRRPQRAALLPALSNPECLKMAGCYPMWSTPRIDPNPTVVTVCYRVGQ